MRVGGERVGREIEREWDTDRERQGREEIEREREAQTDKLTEITRSGRRK